MTKTYRFQTDGEIDIHDLTPIARDFLKKSELSEGRLTVFVNGSTGAIATTEFEPRLTKDNKRIIEELVPKGAGYNHDRIDNNAHSHLRATLLGCEKSIPFQKGRLMLGTWQQIVFVELDVKPRNRTVIFQFMGVK